MSSNWTRVRQPSVISPLIHEQKGCKRFWNTNNNLEEKQRILFSLLSQRRRPKRMRLSGGNASVWGSKGCNAAALGSQTHNQLHSTRTTDISWILRSWDGLPSWHPFMGQAADRWARSFPLEGMPMRLIYEIAQEALRVWNTPWSIKKLQQVYSYKGLNLPGKSSASLNARVIHSQKTAPAGSHHIPQNTEEHRPQHLSQS